MMGNAASTSDETQPVTVIGKRQQQQQQQLQHSKGNREPSESSQTVVGVSSSSEENDTIPGQQQSDSPAAMRHLSEKQRKSSAGRATKSTSSNRGVMPHNAAKQQVAGHAANNGSGGNRHPLGGAGSGGGSQSMVSDHRDDDIHSTVNHIRDEQVHVNLAMADLMAYLQVVANNSNNLPLTRRDDPELGKMVSSLSSEEYARKSAAFIPADVRVIGGSFIKYGRVWDLPTSEEYNATDGAQEPGRSYGGACSNGMLKVLYDAANEAADAAQTMEACDALFDDDEDEESLVSSVIPLKRNSTFASLDIQEHSNPSTMTWTDLLRKMKAEIKDIEFAQVPALTSTRKFDLNQPFRLTPESFDPKTGKKRSLLVGCNYNHLQGAQLKASHDDVRSMKDYIVNVHGFPDSDDMMTILLDDDEHKHPTFMNITEAFKSLSEESQPGDAVFVQFSGHGGRVLDSPVDSEAESYDEVVAPSDYNQSGLIRDTLIFKTLLAPMRYGVTVTILIDCCDTGMMLELPYSWSTRHDRSGHVAKMSQNDDFSFVRFLKVVKTLYETSTFTQLGNVVGSALGMQPPGKDEDDTVAFTECSQTDDSHKVLDGAKPTLFQMICGSAEVPPKKSSSKSKKQKNGRKNSGRDRGGDGATIDTRHERNPSLLEQIVNCTLGHPDDLSDEDTYKDHSFDEGFVDDDSTFDTADDGTDHDDAYEASRRQARGRSRRRRV